MIAAYALRRLDASALLPELRTALTQFIERDAPPGDQLQWGGVILRLYHILGGTDNHLIQPFVAAWSMLAAFLERLDHLEDGDVPIHLPHDNTSTPASELHVMRAIGAEYNRVISYHFLATGMLDQLDANLISPTRLLRLYQLWANCLLRAASGQQCDLEAALAPPETVSYEGLAALEQYQRVTQTKAGPIFALAFAGTAMLTTDDETVITALSLAGEAYGTLLQYGDDMSDADLSEESPLSLPHAYKAARKVSNTLPMNDDLSGYWAYVYSAYVQHVDQVLAITAPTIRAGIRDIFGDTFHQHVTSQASQE